VFDLVVEGLANKVVASRLEVAEKTVKVHRARAMKKVGATSLADLIFLANTAEPDEP
jgi:FixJ family two-component response regulator